MVERAADLQAVQIGIEAVAGTSVPAGTRLNTLGDFTLSDHVEVDSDRVPTGTKFPSFVIPGREWAQGSFDGQLSYSELPYFLAGIIGPAAIAPSGAGVAKTWAFEISRAAQDFPATFTIEQGNPERAHKAVFCFIPELTIRITPDAAEMSGSIMGRTFADNIGAMTANPTSPELKPIHPSHCSVYLDETGAGLGTTKLLRDFVYELSIGSKYTAVFPIDSAMARGFAGIVETRPAISLSLTMEADAQGMANLPRLRTGSKVFVRAEAIGGIVEAADTYRLRIDGAFNVDDMGDFGSEQDVVSNEWGFVNAWDDTWDAALQIEVVNALAAL